MKLITLNLSAKEAGPIDALIRENYEAPRAQIRALFDNGCVLLDSKPCFNPGLRIKTGQKITLTYEEGRRYREKKKRPVSADFDIVFEDGHLIVVDKAAGVLTVPTESGMGEGNSLLDQLSESVSSARSLEVIHRLDRDTSGLLVFAKSSGITRKLKEQFENRKPERVYFAIVRGSLKEKKGSFESYLSTDKDLNQYSVKDPDQGKHALTHYTVIKEMDDSSLVRVELETGRRNQIRVHFSEAGHPVLGDQRYQAARARHPNWKYHALALHAASLGFIHPATGKKLRFTSPMPERMEKFISETGAKLA